MHSDSIESEDCKCMSKKAKEGQLKDYMDRARTERIASAPSDAFAAEEMRRLLSKSVSGFWKSCSFKIAQISCLHASHKEIAA